jgi:hypothetical protein
MDAKFDEFVALFANYPRLQDNLTVNDRPAPNGTSWRN